MSKSAPKDVLCKLLLFATGLPRLASRFMIPSLRLSGLDLAVVVLPSNFDRAKSNFIGTSLASPRGLRGSTLVLEFPVEFSPSAPSFSSPEVRRDSGGVALPWLAESLRARRIGSLEVARVLGDDRNGAGRRSTNFPVFLVVTGGGASGGENELADVVTWSFADLGLKPRDRASGESGEFGDLGDLAE